MAPSGVLAAVLPSGQQPNSVLSQDERSSTAARVGVAKVGPAVAGEESEDEEEEKKMKIMMEKNIHKRFFAKTSLIAWRCVKRLFHISIKRNCSLLIG